MVYKNDAYLELANIMYLYRDRSHEYVLEMTSNVQILIQEIHNYCLHYVAERYDNNNNAYYDFCEEDEVFINQRISDIEFIIIETIIYFRKKYRKNELICNLLNEISENFMNRDINYYATIAHGAWTNRYQDMVMYHSIYNAKIKEEIKQENYVRNRGSFMNIFDPTTWFDIKEPMYMQ